jgi:hypothetical protein
LTPPRVHVTGRHVLIGEPIEFLAGTARTGKTSLLFPANPFSYALKVWVVLGFKLAPRCRRHVAPLLNTLVALSSPKNSIVEG